MVVCQQAYASRVPHGCVSTRLASLVLLILLVLILVLKLLRLHTRTGE